MEKLFILKRDAIGKRTFIKKEQSKENSSFTHLPSNDLMELLKQIKAGNTKSMESLSAQYIRLVINICNDYKGNGLTDMELILKGNAGLIKAAENYDGDRGIDFNAYASWSIRQEIIQAIDEKELNKPMPLNQIGLLSKKKYWSQNHKERIGNML